MKKNIDLKTYYLYLLMTEIVNKYQNGKIYKLLNSINDEVYIGSTFQKLCQRMTKHRNSAKDLNKNKNTFYTYANELGMSFFYIELLENFPCSNKEELRAREGYWIRQIGTLNAKIAGRTPKQYYEDNKEQISSNHKAYYEAKKDEVTECKKRWNEKNRDTIRAKTQIYMNEHKTEIHEYMKQRYQNNKEVLAKQHKDYYERNKENITEKKKQKIQCVCGSCYIHMNKSRHLKTEKHRAYEKHIKQENETLQIIE